MNGSGVMKVIKMMKYVSPLIFCSIMMWILTGKWMKEGLEPKANGVNEYAIVLGARVHGELPSKSLGYRLESALQYALHHPHVTFILSGGQGPGEHVSEAEAMKRFLLKNGIRNERLLLEPASTSTYENIYFSIKLLPDSIKQITIITSDYHLARARMIAEKLGYQTDVVVAKTPMSVEKRMRNRERLALLKNIQFKFNKWVIK